MAAPRRDGEARVLAFYLPQFHAIPENDRWWGEGFTDWDNVRAAKPLFSGHRQPLAPGELGYADPSRAEVRAAQAELAKTHGIDGFVFYHYWFAGRRLLEKPLEETLKTSVPDFPFCLCWANEPWTRRWDGSESDVLMPQAHSLEDDADHFRCLERFFADPRYIRVEDKPLFLVYRSELLPEPRRTTELWRELARKAGLSGLYLARVEGITPGIDPAAHGFDAAVEFAPDWRMTGPPLRPGPATPGPGGRPEIPAEPGYIDHRVHLYDEVVRAMLAKSPPLYPFHRCAFPSWDNTARRMRSGEATIIHGATPDAFRDFLEQALLDAYAHQPPDRRLVFVNAWNEWAEGCHLEPDADHGRAWLEAVRKARARTSFMAPVAAGYLPPDRQSLAMARALCQTAGDAREERERIEAARAEAVKEREEAARTRDALSRAESELAGVAKALADVHASRTYRLVDSMVRSTKKFLGKGGRK